MAQFQSHHVTVELKNGYQFLVRFDDVPGAPKLLCDEPPPLGDGKGPNPAAVLAAAVGNCLAASFVYCLRKARVEPTGLTARVTSHVARDGRGRFRIAAIDVALSPEGMTADGNSTKRCEEIFEDFCTVTASIRQGIPVSVSLDKAKKTAA
jgi:uncharacterized OsmC-like protein